MKQLNEHELPQDILDELDKPLKDSSTMSMKAPSDVVLQAVGTYLEDLLNDAVQYRQESGIEEVWTLCEERYAGIDDANRHEFKQLKFVKPTVMNAPLTTAGTPKNVDMKSTVFVRLTSRYVDAAAAKVGEILIGDPSFSMSATPVPDLMKGKEDTSPVMENGQPLMRDARPGEVPPPAPAGPPPQPPTGAPPSFLGGGAPPAPGALPGQPPPPEQAQGAPPAPAEVPIQTKDLVEEAIALATIGVKKAERRINDWHVECHLNRELRKVIRDAARIGVGVLKGPYPNEQRSMSLKKSADGNGAELEIHKSLVPASRRINPWDVFPARSCGDSIREGDYIFERDRMSAKRVRALKKLPGYIASQIDKALSLPPSGGVDMATRDPSEPESKAKSQYIVWHFTGTIQREAFENLNSNAARLLKPGQDEVFALVTMIEKEVVKVTLNPLSSGDLNYHSVPWLPRDGFWAGVGPGEQVFSPQKIVNAATRAMMNNAGVSSGGQIIIDQGSVVPADDSWILTPNKVWYKTNDGQIDDVRKAFTTFNIESRVNDLMAIIEYGMRLAEESTSIPLVTQGLSGPSTPQTLGQAQLQNNNANQLLRSVGYAFDDYLTDPHTRQYYEYLLLDPDVPDDEKTDSTIDAHGSTAKVERTIQDQSITELTSMSENPIYGVNPKKWFAMVLKSRHMNPVEVQWSEDEQKKMDAQPKPEEPGIQIAKIKAGIADKQMAADQAQAQAEAQLETQLSQNTLAAKGEMEKLRNETIRLRSKLDTDRDTVYVETQKSKAQADFEHAMKKLELERELAIMDYASKNDINLSTMKTKLADTAMKLRVQKELSAADAAVTLHTHNVKPGTRTARPMPSPVEIPGRAPAGKSFQQ